MRGPIRIVLEVWRDEMGGDCVSCIPSLCNIPSSTEGHSSCSPKGSTRMCTLVSDAPRVLAMMILPTVGRRT
jgi:hypothetical protein